MTPLLFSSSWRLGEFLVFSLLPRLTSFYRLSPTPSPPLVISHTSWRLYTRSSAEKQPKFVPPKTLPLSSSRCLHKPASFLLPCLGKQPPLLTAAEQIQRLPLLSQRDAHSSPSLRSRPTAESLPPAGWRLVLAPQRGREGPPVTVPRVFEHKAPSHCAATRHRSPNASCF